MRSTAVFIRFLFLSIAFFIAGAAVYAQKQNPSNTSGQELAEDDVVRVNTTLVTVPVSVSDHQGRFIPDLSQKQFRFEGNYPASPISSLTCPNYRTANFATAFPNETESCGSAFPNFL